MISSCAVFVVCVPKFPISAKTFASSASSVGFSSTAGFIHFENAGQPKVFLSSADWMPRNFYRRIEVAFPIENPTLRDQIINDVIPSFLHDRVKARELQPNGTYRRLKPEGSEPRATGAMAISGKFPGNAQKK